MCCSVCLIGNGNVRDSTQIAQQEGEYTNSEGQCDMVLSDLINQSGPGYSRDYDPWFKGN